MRTVPLTFALVLMIALPAAAHHRSDHAAFPLNAVENGGFDDGIAGWVDGEKQKLIPSGCAGGGDALGIDPAPEHASNYVHQHLGELRFPQPTWSLEFCLRASSGDVPGGQGVGLFSDWPGPAHAHVVAFAIGADAAYCFVGPYIVSAPAPADDAWHAIRIAVDLRAGTSTCSVDGEAFATVPAAPDAPEGRLSLLVGQTTGQPSMTVAYDDLRVGPALRLR